MKLSPAETVSETAAVIVPSGRSGTRPEILAAPYNPEVMARFLLNLAPGETARSLSE